MARTIKSCIAGDTIMHPGGNRYVVLARLDDLIFHSESYDHTLAFYRPLSIFQAQKEGWKLLLDGKEPMTIKEAEHYLNVKITE